MADRSYSRPRHPIARVVVVVALLGALPVAALALSSVQTASNALKREVQRRLLSSSQLSAVAIRNEIVGVEQLVDSYAQRQRLVAALQAGNRAGVAVQLQELQHARPGIATTFIARVDGRLVAIAPSTPSIIGKSFSFRDWYKGVTRTQRTYVSQAYQSQATGHPLVVAVTTLIRGPAPSGREGRPIGILVAAYSLGAIQRLAQSFATSQHLELTATDQRGTTLASPGKTSGGLVSRRSDPAVAAALRGLGGIATQRRSGTEELVAYQPIANLGWAVTVAIPKRVALAPLGGIHSSVYEVAGLLEIALLAGLLFLVRSTRSQRRAEEAAERSRREADASRHQAEQARQLAEEAQRQAEQANSAKSEFLSRMSHELRTPLNGVLGFGQLLAMDGLDPEQAESVEQILKAGEHLLVLINEVLDISRIEARALSLSLEAVPICETLQEAVDLVRPLADQQQIAITVELPDQAHPHGRADRQRLKQVLLNLLSNAVKYNRTGGTVQVIVLSDEQTIRLEVKDSGDGIPADKLAQLFQPFERLDADLRQIEGTGLGLVLSKGLIEAMGGRIGAESQPAHGSTFWIELAAAEAPIDTAHPQLEELAAAPAADTPATTVLYIEDNLSNLRLITRILEQRPEIKLISALQGSLGLELARQHHPDLILLDLHLPDIQGDQVLAQLRADPATQHTPVIVLSADATQGRIQRLRAQGADDYLAKPIDVRRLLDLLDTHTRQNSVA